jgi:flagellar basal-body rod protein FlgG
MSDRWAAEPAKEDLMLQGMFTAAAGMNAQQDRIDALANDLANVSTTGYKQVRTAVRDLEYGAASGGRPGAGAGAAATTLGRTWATGALRDTGRPLDVAIEGAGFIKLRLPGGQTALTRDGSLQLNADGALTSSDGHELDPPLKLPAGTQPDDVEIRADGTVAVAGRTVGRITVVTVPAPDGLQPAGNSLYIATRGSGAAAAARSTSVRQGVLEASNVDMARAMVELGEAQRGFELASKAINIQDEALSIANGLKR